MDLSKQFSPRHWSEELQLIYFLSFNLVQITTVCLLVKNLIPFLRAPSSLYTTFLPHLHRTRVGRI